MVDVANNKMRKENDKALSKFLQRDLLKGFMTQNFSDSSFTSTLVTLNQVCYLFGSILSTTLPNPLQKWIENQGEKALHFLSSFFVEFLPQYTQKQ